MKTNMQTMSKTALAEIAMFAVVGVASAIPTISASMKRIGKER